MRSFRTAGLALFGVLLLAQTGRFETLAAKANEARDADRLEDAAKLYNEALSLRPEWAAGWWYLGTLRYEQDAYADAAAALQKVIALRPNDGNAFAMLGLSEAKLGRNNEALGHLQKGRQLGLGGDPRLRNSAAYNEGMLLLGAGAFEQAQETLGSLCREGLDEPALIMGLGSAVLGVPESQAPDMVRQAGWAEHFAAQRDQLPAAQREYERLAKEFPKGRNVQFAYGRFLLANHYEDQALAAFEREIENSPRHLLARLGIAGIMERNNPAGGIKYAREAVELSPKLAEGHYLLGMLQLKTDQIAPAIAELETSQRLRPDDPRVYFGLGRAYARANRAQDAAQARATYARLTKQTEQNRR